MPASIRATVSSMIRAAPRPRRRELQQRAAPVIGGGASGDVPHGDQALNELADGLLGDAHAGDEVTTAQPRLRLRERADRPDAPLGEISEARAVKRLGHGSRVAADGPAQEPAESLWVARRRQAGFWSDAGGHALTLGQL